MIQCIDIFLVRITLYQLGIELNLVSENVTMVNSSFKMFLF